ncbi:transglycosylase family protein [Brachybacterium sp. GPGPB12]|uniref:transglycosylase family protein n=1 Tax=Brachybacterium sp. GPGPB12 TaxID=3023517 RepID=UPI00313429DB
MRALSRARAGRHRGGVPGAGVQVSGLPVGRTLRRAAIPPLCPTRAAPSPSEESPMTATRTNTHRAPGRAVAFRGVNVAPKLAAATGGAVVVAGLGLAGAESATAQGTVWDEVAQCESGGNWSINTGNGYYGGLQFSGSTWRAFGGGEYASTANQASKAEQIAVAQRTLQAQGPGAWPTCGKKAGLTRSNGGADANARTRPQFGRRLPRRGPHQPLLRRARGRRQVRARHHPRPPGLGGREQGRLPLHLRHQGPAVEGRRRGRREDRAGDHPQARAAIGLGSNGARDFRSDSSTVKSLQNFLNSGRTGSAPAVSAPKASAPSSSASLVVDGKFGPATTRALEGWVGVSQDGSLSTSDIKARRRRSAARRTARSAPRPPASSAPRWA